MTNIRTYGQRGMKKVRTYGKSGMKKIRIYGQTDMKKIRTYGHTGMTKTIDTFRKCFSNAPITSVLEQSPLQTLLVAHPNKKYPAFFTRCRPVNCACATLLRASIMSDTEQKHKIKREFLYYVKICVKIERLRSQLHISQVLNSSLVLPTGHQKKYFAQTANVSAINGFHHFSSTS